MKKIFLFTLLFSVSIHGQDSLSIEHESESGIFSKKTLSFAGITGFYGFTLVHSYVMWWKNNYEPFHFYNKPGNKDWFDEPASLGIDKVGHFYTSYAFYVFQKNLLRWGGHPESFSKWFSAGLTGGMALLIEIGDGFSAYGFDYQDLIFNLGGLGFGLLQDEFPVLKNFNFKWSFVPPDGFEFPPRFTEHYDGHIYWLTVNIHSLLESSLGEWFPEIIQPAIGFSVADRGRRREFVVGIDFNLLDLFNSKDENWKLVSETLNLYHFPAPGAKFSPQTKPEFKLFLLN